MEEFMAVSERSTENKGAGKGPWVWFADVVVHPRRVFSEIAALESAVWLKPMLVLTALTILLSLVGGPARALNAQMNMGQPPEDFMYWSEEQQNQFFESQQAAQGPMFIYFLPMLGSLVSLWLGWFILGSVLHLLMTFGGSRQPQGAYLNLVAWAGVPFALRCLVQAVALLATRQLIDDPGLSGFIAAEANGGLDLVRILLGMIDVYALGFAALVLIGAPVISGLKVKKSLWIAGAAVLVFVVLAAMPGFILGQFDGLGTIRPFFIF
jgi:hypothetical protein